MYKYPIIVFEGIEGSGKSSHIKNLERHLKKNKIKYLKLREPGGSKNSENIRKLILSIIKKNYQKKIILLDRFVDSTIAYQHYGMGLNKKLILYLNKIILKNIKPSFTFLNVVSMKNLKSRLKIRSNKNRYDNFNITFYNKVQRGYIKLSKNKKNYMIINSNKKIDENRKTIIKKINSLLKI